MDAVPQNLRGGKSITSFSHSKPRTTTISGSHSRRSKKKGMKRPAQNHQRILDEGFVSSSSNDIDMMLEDIKSGDSKMDGRSSGEGSIMRCDEPDPEAMDALIASELKSLSLEERAAVYEDVHGVAPPTEEETPEAIANWIERFKEILRKNRSKAEYEKAAFLNPDYVTDPKILMIFIRAEDYDIKAAVQRIINHYKHKLELFGIDKLARPITFEDLDEDDKAAAMTGFYQKLDLPDQSGRPVLITFPHLMNFKTVINQVRALWYLLMSAVQDDEEAQKNGFVAVAYSTGLKDEESALPKGQLELGLKASFLIDTIPYKLRAFHLCHESQLLRPLLATMQMAMGLKSRLRARTHCGSHTECKYELMTFGIPVALIPMDDDGRVDMSSFLRMTAEQRRQEETQSNREKEEEARGRILFPCANDVLLGRGRPYQDFPGNLRLAALVEEHRSTYKGLSKRNKPTYAESIIRIVKEDLNGRFLKKAPNIAGATNDIPDQSLSSFSSSTTVCEAPAAPAARTGGDDTQQEEGSRQRQEQKRESSGGAGDFFYWVEVDDEVARDKVGHSFRTKPTRRGSGDSSSTGIGSTRTNSSSYRNTSTIPAWGGAPSRNNTPPRPASGSAAAASHRSSTEEDDEDGDSSSAARISTEEDMIGHYIPAGEGEEEEPKNCFARRRNSGIVAAAAAAPSVSKRARVGRRSSSPEEEQQDDDEAEEEEAEDGENRGGAGGTTSGGSMPPS